eukprot:GHVO01044550.1.p1 GENE.GHVO01044550.1~~GHVO01044550.1.p1  ORF type:complete len:139 (+),score=18.70 GHVO01044550.1:39-455(+)
MYQNVHQLTNQFSVLVASLFAAYLKLGDRFWRVVPVSIKGQILDRDRKLIFRSFSVVLVLLFIRWFTGAPLIELVVRPPRQEDAMHSTSPLASLLSFVVGVITQLTPLVLPLYIMGRLAERPPNRQPRRTYRGGGGSV